MFIVRLWNHEQLSSLSKQKVGMHFHSSNCGQYKFEEELVIYVQKYSQFRPKCKQVKEKLPVIE